MANLTIVSKINSLRPIDGLEVPLNFEIPNGQKNNGQPKFKTVTWYVTGLYDLNHKCEGLRLYKLEENKKDGYTVTVPITDYRFSDNTGLKPIDRKNDALRFYAESQLLTREFLSLLVQLNVVPRILLLKFEFFMLLHTLENFDARNQVVQVSTEQYQEFYTKSVQSVVFHYPGILPTAMSNQLLEAIKTVVPSVESTENKQENRKKTAQTSPKHPKASWSKSQMIAFLNECEIAIPKDCNTKAKLLSLIPA